MVKNSDSNITQANSKQKIESTFCAKF